MTFSSDAETAMILPVPIAAGAGEDAVDFVALDGYRRFFDDLEHHFQEIARTPGLMGGFGLTSSEVLHVRHVGAFEASFVPHMGLWDRLDARFRIPANVWDHLPTYKSFGFVVFKLQSGKHQKAHPMAFSFPTRDPETLFFPTVHIHDGTVPEDALFDHTFYTQNHPRRDSSSTVPFWMPSVSPASKFLSVRRAHGLIDGSAICWQGALQGMSRNADTLVRI